MSARQWIALSMVFIAGAGAGGCHHRTRSVAASPPAPQDSLSGTIAVTGTAFEQHISIRTGESSRELAASSDDSSALSSLGGVDVVVRGSYVGNRFAVTEFVVRSVDGASVSDGVLVRDGSHLGIRTRIGTVPLGNPPVAFDSLIGARLWVGGPLDTGPNVYGVIQPVRK